MNSYTRITSIDEMLKSLEAITIGRNNIKSFTRNRKMDFYTITTSMIYKKGQTLSLEISEFTERMKKKEITKQAYSKQRKNLNPEIFKYLNENYIKKIYKEIEVKKYKGYIVLSVDASSSTTTCTTNTYETLKGQAASTTGNITGIYDMNGGGI